MTSADDHPQVPFLSPDDPLSIRRLEQMTSMSREELDELPIGVIRVDRQGTVLEYNATEARLAGLDPEDVMGKNFFTEVAPCTNVQQFAGRFLGELGAAQPSIVFPYEFNFSGKRVHVTVLMHFEEKSNCGWIFVSKNLKGDTESGSRRDLSR